MYLHQFYFESIRRCQLTKERYGQALFNQLELVRPDLSAQVRGTTKDVFYMNGPADNFEKWDSFVHFIETNWYKKDSESNGN
jgi:hypothetical protein